MNPTCTTSKHLYGTAMATTISQLYSSSNYIRSSTTSIQVEERKNSDDSVTEATNMAMSICGDELSVRASSIFGGLKYYNTDIDNRFRVLFVLGGPGNYNPYTTTFFMEHALNTHTQFTIISIYDRKGRGKVHKVH